MIHLRSSIWKVKIALFKGWWRARARVLERVGMMQIEVSERREEKLP